MTPKQKRRRRKVTVARLKRHTISASPGLMALMLCLQHFQILVGQ